MSEVERLIEVLCPEGVKLRKIKEMYTRLKGTPITAEKMKQIDSLDGDVRIFAGGRTVIDAFEEDIPNANITRVPAVLIQSRGVIDAIYYDAPFTFKNEMWAYTAENEISVKYLYYVMKNNIQYFRDTASGMGSLPQISLKVTEDFLIPIPPLEVQREIVRILDNFTELTTELTLELMEELTARKKQYEHYRDSLLTFGDDVTMLTLGEVATDMYRGAGIKRVEITEEGTPCVRYGEIYTTYKIWFDTCVSHTRSGSKYFEHGDVLFAITGERVNEIAKSCVYMGNVKCFAGGDIAVMKHNQNPKYMSYALSTTAAQMQKSKGKVKSKVVHSSIPSLKKIVIPVPSLDEQARIVDILDKLDALTTDISTSLSAEIEARSKQYEYYRDKVLTFKEAKK